MKEKSIVQAVPVRLSPLELPVSQYGQRRVRSEPTHAPCALGKQIVLSVHVDHPILQNALPLVLYASDLKHISGLNRLLGKLIRYLVICAKDDVAITRAIFLSVFLFLRVRIIQVTIYSLVVRRRRRRLRRLRQRRVL